ncbi:MAG: OsmC family peroxiredoxin, partial [Nocardiopsis sp. BM-2018]
MPVRTSTGTWRGSLKEGSGTFALGSGAFEGPYSFPSRFEEGPGSNPEELIGAALAACYSMFLSNLLASAGSVPTEVHTEARVHLGRDDVGPAITTIELVCRAEVPGITPEAFA